MRQVTLPQPEIKVSRPAEDVELTAKAIARSLTLDGPVQYKLVQARSILNRVRSGGMPLNWTINPYRGCRHACVYCFARPTHTYYGLNAGADFHSKIFVKINAPQLLRTELSRPGWKGETICLGSVTDPYQPAERRYHLSRQIIEILAGAANPLEIITKSHLILNDLDVLTELNRRTGNRGKVAVNMSLITLDEAKARLIDPGAPAPRKRIETLAKLSAAGIKTRMFIMPVLPGITDQPEELEELVRVAAEAGVTSVAADPLRIARGLEDYFYSFVERHFPEALPRYARLYANRRRTTVDSRYRDALREKMMELRSRYNLIERGREEEEIEPQIIQAQQTVMDSLLV